MSMVIVIENKLIVDGVKGGTPSLPNLIVVSPIILQRAVG